MKIGPGAAVEIEYELATKSGQIIESSARSGPLRYVHGDGKMLPGLERRLEGLGPGDERQGELPAHEAFGTEDALPVKEMPRSAFPAQATPKAGAIFEAKDPVTGAPVRFKTLAVEEDLVRVRLLHPLVGQDIEYRVKVLSVRDPNVRGVPPPTPGVVELDTDEIQEV